jgi:hypothetical protein
MPVLFLANTANLSGIFYHRNLYIIVSHYILPVFYFMYVFS